MELQQQQHSYLQKQGNDFVSSSVSSHNSTGSRLFEYSQNTFVQGGAASQWMLPLFNALQIETGTGISKRTGNNIFIHRIEVSYSIVESSTNWVIPEVITSNQNGVNVMTDNRMRLLVVTPKQQYRFLPTSGVGKDPVYPYWSATATGDYPEPISPPVNTDQDHDSGMQLLPNPFYYNVEYDDLKNLKYMTSFGMNTGSMSFLVRKNYTYQPDVDTTTQKIRANDNAIQEALPQIWFLFPNQYQNHLRTQFANPVYEIAWSVRIIYDNQV